MVDIACLVAAALGIDGVGAKRPKGCRIHEAVVVTSQIQPAAPADKARVGADEGAFWEGFSGKEPIAC